MSRRIVRIALIGCFGLFSVCSIAQERDDRADLSGAVMVHQYPDGGRFRTRFGDEKVTFQILHIEGQPTQPPYTYQAQRVEPGVYLVAWLQADETHITFLIDTNKKRLYNSLVWGPAMRERQSEVWGIPQAEIVEFEWGPNESVD